MCEQCNVAAAANRETGDDLETDDGAEFAKVELMGHRVRWGQIAEVERFGAKLLRVVFLDDELETKIEEYSGSAIFCLTTITREELDAHQAQQRKWQADELAYRQRRIDMLTAPELTDPFRDDVETSGEEGE